MIIFAQEIRNKMAEQVRYIEKEKSPYADDTCRYPEPGIIRADVHFPEFRMDEFQNEFEWWMTSNRLRKRFPEKPQKPVISTVYFKDKPIAPVKPREPEKRPRPVPPPLVDPEKIAMRLCPRFDYRRYWNAASTTSDTEEVREFIITRCPCNSLDCFLDEPYKFEKPIDYITYIREIQDKIYYTYRSKRTRTKDYEKHPAIQLLDMQLDDYIAALHRFKTNANVDANLIVRQNHQIAEDGSKRPFKMMNESEKLYLVPGSSYYKRTCSEITAYFKELEDYKKYEKTNQQKWDDYFKKMQAYEKEYYRYLDRYNSSIIVPGEFEDALNNYEQNMEQWRIDVHRYGPARKLTIEDYLLINYLYDDFDKDTGGELYLSDGRSYEFPEWLRGKRTSGLNKPKSNWDHRESYREFLKMNPSISKATNDKYEIRSASEHWNMRTFVKAWVINHFTGMYEDVIINVDK